MRTLVERIKTYYEKGIYSDAQIDAMYKAGKITAEERDYIKSV